MNLYYLHLNVFPRVFSASLIYVTVPYFLLTLYTYMQLLNSTLDNKTPRKIPIGTTGNKYVRVLFYTHWKSGDICSFVYAVYCIEQKATNTY